jgi:hypothetical protein
MHIQPRRAIIFLAAFAALALAATAWADSGTQTAPDNGGTVAGSPTSVEPSGGVAGPEAKKPARSAQTTSPEEPPQVETTPTETTPSDNTGEEPSTPTNTTTDEGAGTAPSAGTGAGGGGGGGGGGGLPHTGLEIGALTALGLGLLLAGVTLRRWREA